VGIIVPIFLFSAREQCYYYCSCFPFLFFSCLLLLCFIFSCFTSASYHVLGGIVVGFRSDRCNWEKWGAIIIRKSWFCFLILIVVILLLLIIVVLGLPGAIIITITNLRGEWW
jgi:succinate dehydrogenase/fumarate reductase cytochrome b subunit